MSQPARLQIDVDQIPDDDKPPQTGTAFNIWFMQWLGGDSRKSYVKLNYRVNIKQDAGTTRAIDGKSPLCLFFARGCCYRGPKCPYLHRLPKDTDYIMPTQDCFGRDKTADYRDDMDGVGSFNKTNRTLFVGGLHISDKIDAKLKKQFLEFGDVERMRVLPAKACAFITFRTEPQAQFAKEAMQNQSLDENDVLVIRWANDDPNMEAQLEEKKRLEQLAIKTVRDLLREKEAVPVVEEPEEPQEQPQKRPLELEAPATPASILDGIDLTLLKRIKVNKLVDYSSDSD